MPSVWERFLSIEQFCLLGFFCLRFLFKNRKEIKCPSWVAVCLAAATACPQCLPGGKQKMGPEIHTSSGMTPPVKPKSGARDPGPQRTGDLELPSQQRHQRQAVSRGQVGQPWVPPGPASYNETIKSSSGPCLLASWHASPTATSRT